MEPELRPFFNSHDLAAEFIIYVAEGKLESPHGVGAIDAKTTELLFCLCSNGSQAFDRSYVAPDGSGILTQLGLPALRRVLIMTGYRHLCSFQNEEPGGGKNDAACTTRDQRRFIWNAHFHSPIAASPLIDPMSRA